MQAVGFFVGLYPKTSDCLQLKNYQKLSNHSKSKRARKCTELHWKLAIGVKFLTTITRATTSRKKNKKKKKK